MTTSIQIQKMGEVLTPMIKDGHERIIFAHEPVSGLRSIIAIHDRTMGPALGGLRFFPYSDEQSALKDVMNLAKAMTYKSALADLSVGGGKSVIIGNPQIDKTEALLRSFGKVLNDLNGAYIVAEDAGTSQKDMDVIRRSTRFVTGASTSSGGAGDPSPVTAMGIFEGMKACVKHVFDRDDLSGIKVAIQGVGNVGFPLAKHLHQAGAKLVVSDKNQDHIKTAVKELGVQAVAPEDIFGIDCDIFSPCAMGGAINENTIQKLKCKIIAGAANNQLASEEIAEKLVTKGIVYAPDFVINAGGIIHVAQELEGYEWKKVEVRVQRIYNTILQILERSQSQKLPPSKIAVAMAKDRLAAKRLKD